MNIKVNNAIAKMAGFKFSIGDILWYKSSYTSNSVFTSKYEIISAEFNKKMGTMHVDIYYVKNTSSNNTFILERSYAEKMLTKLDI